MGLFENFGEILSGIERDSSLIHDDGMHVLRSSGVMVALTTSSNLLTSDKTRTFEVRVKKTSARAQAIFPSDLAHEAHSRRF